MDATSLVVAKGRAGVWVHWILLTTIFYDFENWYNVTKEVSAAVASHAQFVVSKAPRLMYRRWMQGECPSTMPIKVKHGGLLDYL